MQSLSVKCQRWGLEIEKESPRKRGALKGEVKSAFKFSSILTTQAGVFWEVRAGGGEWRIQLQLTYHRSQNLEYQSCQVTGGVCVCVKIAGFPLKFQKDHN